MRTLRQINKKDWGEIGDPEYLCTLPLYPADLKIHLNIDFFEFDDDGLGLCQSSVLEIDEIKYWLEAHPEGPEIAQYLSVMVRSFEPDSEHALFVLLETIKLKRSDLIWENEGLGPAQWVLTRLDDNGNNFEVQKFLNERSANWVKQKYENRGHKQSYFIKQMI
jgi:hypothetical protein